MLIFLCPLALMFTQCLNTDKKADVRGADYAGSAACIKCHQDIYDTYTQTGHYQSTRATSVHTLHGDFTAGHNLFTFNDHSTIQMVKKDSGFYQVCLKEGQQLRSEKFDITFGGVKAETFLYWKGNQPFQLPVSYFKALNGWANSPGYGADFPYFDRLIIRRCFECHSSFINELPQQDAGMMNHVTEFDKNSIVYGIDCERCHGPAANHVNFQTANPGEKTAKYIVTYQSLSRSQRLDACAVCHGGNKEVFQVSAFKFKPGDVLANFKEPDFGHKAPDPNSIDVHGNQSGLLAASKCFLMSNMDCATCHDVHKNQSASLAAYSQRCIKCHNAANHNFCTMQPASVTAANCIDCHMPLKPSGAIEITSAGNKKENPYLVRTHYITIYPAETKKVLAMIKKF